MIVHVGCAFVLFAAVATAGDLHVQAGMSIQSAIASAHSGDRVLVDPGTYAEAIDFLGKEIEVIGVGGAAATTIDGTGQNVSVVTIDGGVGQNARLAGFTIRGGTGTHAAFPPGALIGGGIYVGIGSPLIELCVIEDNTARNGLGGGAFLSSTTRFLRSIVRSNSAAYGGGVSGGQLDRVLIQANTATGDGGGAAWTVSMRSCRLDGNTANGLGGGAVLIPPGDQGAEFCSFTNNQAKFGGGAYVADSGTNSLAALRRCRIEGNVATQGGGGIWMVAYTDPNFGSSGGIALDSCIVRQNTSLNGFASGAYLDVLGACPTCGSISARQTVFDANDIVNPGYAVFEGCIFVNHPNPLNAGTVNWSVTPIPYPGTGCSAWDPLFVDAAGGDLHLTAQSPCLGIVPTAIPDMDIDGDLRSPPVAAMGADERAAHVYVHGDPTPGATVALRIAGTPGDNVMLFASMTLLSAPIATPYGPFMLGFPLLYTNPVPLGAIPANGVMSLPVPLPSNLPLFLTLHTQCLLQGPTTTVFTNAETLVLM